MSVAAFHSSAPYHGSALINEFLGTEIELERVLKPVVHSAHMDHKKFPNFKQCIKQSWNGKDTVLVRSA